MLRFSSPRLTTLFALVVGLGNFGGGNLATLSWGADAFEAPGKSKPNVLMICIDDLNDWVEPLAGHPDVKTPVMKELAERGINFTNAHCQAPLCNPSRTSVMTSMRPSTSGVYGLDPWFRKLPSLQDVVSMPQQFRMAGYRTYSAGKVYHNNWGRNPSDEARREFDVWGPQGWPGVMPEKKLLPPTPLGDNPWVDWGVFDHDESDKGDAIVAEWGEKTLREMPKDQPFFMSIGFFLPHVPCHVTPRWWDVYDHDGLTLPRVPEDDRADCSPFSWYLQWKTPSPRMSWVRHHNQHRNLVHSYLSSISFVDHQVGRILKALDEAGLRESTHICLWSDHGFHLGEKGVTGKITLWERSTRVPLIFAGPGITTGTSAEPVELLDVFPTLCELASVSIPETVEGVSLIPQLADPTVPTSKPAITDHNPGSHAVRDRRYRLIHYADGSEELYDLELDPNELENLIGSTSHAPIATRLREFVPESSAPLAEGSRTRTLEGRQDGWYWEGQRIDPSDPPMSTGPHGVADFSKIPGPAGLLKIQGP